jgi:hypothetical protein
MHLPRDPGRSDIEVSVDAPWTLLLNEDAEQMLQGVINSTKALIETTATDLLDFWLWRRENQQSLQQPATQWLKGRSTEPKGFNGYAPGTLPLAPGMVMVHPVVARRFLSAAVGDVRLTGHVPSYHHKDISLDSCSTV